LVMDGFAIPLRPGLRFSQTAKSEMT
jgi:hypothetical protein